MMIFQFPKYFLCFFFLIIAYQPQLTFTSYSQRCGTYLKYNDYRKLIGPVCSPNYAKFISCLQSKLNKSTSAVDHQFYNSVDFTNFEKKTDRFCNKYNRLDFEKNHCDTSSIKIPKSSALCVDDHVRLEYLKLKKCPVNVRMLWFAYRESTFRNGCLIIDPWYQIIPRYGPDIACYRDFVETSENLRRDNTSLVDVYEKFWFVTFTNCWDAKYGAIVQNIVTFCKVSALIVIIAVGLKHISEGHLENFKDAFVTEGITVSGVGFAIYSGLYSYMGWDALNFGYEEIKKAETVVPLAITLGLGLSMVVYLLTNVAYHAVLTNQEILSGIAVAVVFGERMHKILKWFILPCVALSAAGILNVILFKCSRSMYTAGRSQLFPRFLSMIHTERKTPIPALLLSSLLATVIIWLNDIQAILGSYTQINNIGYMLTIAGLFRLRKSTKYKDNNELKVHTIFPVIFLVLGILLFSMSLIGSALMTFVAILVILLGLPIYYIFNERFSRSKWITAINENLSRICRLVLSCEFCEKELKSGKD